MGKQGRSARSAVILLSIVAFLIALVAFILTVVIWADPKLVPNIKENYYESDAVMVAEPDKEPEPSEEPGASEEPEPEPSMMLDFGEHGKVGKDDRTYTFGVYTSLWPSGFLDEEGRLSGFVMDIVSRLCREAEKKCRFIALKSYGTMWDGTLHVSEGLLRRYFDAGLFVSHTATRAAGYAYTEPLWSRWSSSVIYTRRNASYSASDLTTKKIGLIEGWYTSVECLQRETGTEIPPENIVMFRGTPELIAALKDHTIDLAFVIHNDIFEKELQQGKAYPGACSNGDMSMIVRKDSPLQGWMTTVTKEMKKNGQYKILCDELDEKYGQSINCDI